MTKQDLAPHNFSHRKLPHGLIRPFVITLMAATAIPVIMAAPSAYAGEKANKYNRDNTYQADRARDKRKAHNRSRTKAKHTGQRERNWRNDRRLGHGDWSNDRERQRRFERAQRQQREAREHRRDNRSHRVNHRDERAHRRIDRHDSRRHDRTHRRHDRAHRRHDRYHDRNHRRADRRHWNNRNDRYWRRQARRHNNYRPYWNNRRHTGWNDYYHGYQTNYRSSLGISFIFGQPGYSRYRWAPSRYSYYQPSYTSYARYQAATQCQRVIIDGFHHGHAELVSVLQCNNPYDGTYIVQGSEQIENCDYGSPYYRR